MTNHLADIVALEATLTELSAAEQQLNGIPEWMRSLHDEHRGRSVEIQTYEETAERAREERRSAEATLAEAQERLKRYQQQINQVSTQREYGALLSEIDTTKAQITAAETAGLAAMERREQAEKDLAVARESFADIEARYAAEMARWESEKPQLEERVGRIREAAKVLRERLPRGTVALYERVRERYQGGGIAPIYEVVRPGKGPKVYHCGACNYSIRPQVVVEVRSMQGLVQCEGCKRILHFSTEAPA